MNNLSSYPIQLSMLLLATLFVVAKLLHAPLTSSIPLYVPPALLVCTLLWPVRVRNE